MRTARTWICSRRLDFAAGAYRASPDWSPDGRRWLSIAHRLGSFQLMTVSLRDRSLKQLTSDGRNEDPSWAPDARHLVFVSDRSGVRQLWVLDTESGRTRQLLRGGAAQLPAWSPRAELELIVPSHRSIAPSLWRIA